MARHLWRFLVGGLLIAAGALGILLCAAGTAAAQNFEIPGIGTVEIPKEIQILPQAEPTRPMTTAPLRIELQTEPGPLAISPAEPAMAEEESARLTALEAARSRLGSEYSAGANGPDSFDCSGLVQWSYDQAGVDVPRTSYDQLATGTPVEVEELEPGDLVSYYDGGHSAIYAGDGEVIHASTSGEGVRMSSIDSMPLTGARRL
ncbi:C40 family peptidase [Nocardia sp. NPDC050712]|uniref:C40 family peptidase n=1 Tax=Nocardia sp. NPDC050712 TaxID=3155518 RepID=UPI0033D1978A